jgi:RPA family protein
MAFSREVAHRIFVAELKESIGYERDDSRDKKAPGYLVTKLGLRANRCLIVGTLAECDDIGVESPFYRGRIIDPSGTILVYAGQYQPIAATALADMPVPSRVLVIGKTNIYRPEEGEQIVSVKAEAVIPADEETRRQWVVEASTSLLARCEENKHYKDVAMHALQTLVDQSVKPAGGWSGDNGPVMR